MRRPRPALLVLALPALSAVLMFAAACSSSPEQQLLQKYFQAARLRDNTTLANIATVEFPVEDGTVQSFDITEPGTEQKRALKLKDLAAAEEAARQADEEFNKKKKEYQDTNRNAIDRVLKAEADPKVKLRGADLEVQTAWTKWREDTAEHAKALTEARQALSAERSLAEISVFDSRNPVDATKYDGELITRNMTIKAKVRRPDGSVEDKDLHVQLSRVELTGGPAERPTVSGRWIVTHMSDAHAGAAPSN